MSRSTGLGVVMALAYVAAQIGVTSVAVGRGSEQTPVPRADGPSYSAGSILVTFKRSTHADARESALRGVSGKSAKTIQHLGTVVVDVPEGTEASAVQKLSHNPNVRWAERDGAAYQVDTVPNDPYFPWTGTSVLSGGQWGHGLTQATKAWDITTGSSNVVIAIVDSGIDAAHPDLAAQVVPGTSFIGGSTTDTHGHGEYVAGAAAASGNNAMGGAGYCWRCKLMPVKISNDGTASYSAMASAITWATDHGARVINISYAGTSQSSTLDSAVSYATNHGSVVVAAAGNSGVNTKSYPAASPGAIAVAASDQHDNLMNYSNFGSWVHVAAPTGDITTWLKDPKTGLPYGYGPVGGTSISSPVVAGIVGLMISAAPNATVGEVKNALFSTTAPITGLAQDGDPVNVQYGRVNAYQAVLALTGQAPSPTPTPTASPRATATATPTPTPTPTPTATANPTPTATPTPTPTPTPTATPTPSNTSQTFTGSLNRKSSSRAFAVALAAGTSDARLTFTKCRTLNLSLQGGETTLASTAGPSVVVLDQATAGGSFSYTVSGTGQCSFTLTVTVAP